MIPMLNMSYRKVKEAIGNSEYRKGTKAHRNTKRQLARRQRVLQNTFRTMKLSYKLKFITEQAQPVPRDTLIFLQAVPRGLYFHLR